MVVPLSSSSIIGRARPEEAWLTDADLVTITDYYHSNNAHEIRPQR
jgi:hypothetical protein